MLTFTGGGIVPGVSRASLVASDRIAPDEVDTVVVGGGIVGCMTALNLVERGMSVAVCEKGDIGGEASCRAAGLIEYQHLAPVKMELIARSIELWRRFGQFDENIGFTDRGAVTLFDGEADADAMTSWLDTTKEFPGVDARILSKQEIQHLEPGIGDGWYGGLLQANALAVEPKLATPAIARAAASKGAKILQNCAVRHIELETGRISGVISEKGRIKTPNVVIAGGIWSPALVKPLGLNLPQLMIFAEMISVEPIANGPKIPLATSAGLVRREADGGYLFGCNSGIAPITPTVLKYFPKLISMSAGIEQGLTAAFNYRTFMHELKANKTSRPGKPSPYEKNRIFQPEFTGKFADGTFAYLRSRMPVFENSKIRERYSGALMTSLDNLGVISAVKSIPGLYLGTGLLYGLTMSTAAGEALADLITGEETKVDVSPYRYERFIDGSKLEFHA